MPGAHEPLTGPATLSGALRRTRAETHGPQASHGRLSRRDRGGRGKAEGHGPPAPAGRRDAAEVRLERRRAPRPARERGDEDGGA